MIVRSTNRLKLVALCGVIVVALFSGCLFEPRTPEPSNPNDDPAVALDDPLRVFEALRKSLLDGRDNNYENALQEEFRFYPLPEDSLDDNFIGTGVFDNWTKTVELDVLNTMLSESNVDSVEFNNSIVLNQNEFVRYRVDYRLRLVGKVGGAVSIWSGIAHFDVINDGGNWRLIQWKDIERKEGYSTWGFLRGTIQLRIGTAQVP